MKKILIFLTLILSISGCTKKEDLKLYNNTFTDYLNTVVQLQIYYPEDFKITPVVDEIKEVLKEYDENFNAYSNTGELYEINSNASKEAVEVSDDMFNVLSLALNYASIFDGAYDPTVLPLVELWGINESSYFMGGVVPKQEEIDKALDLVDYKNLILDENNKTVKFSKEGVKLDLGSVVKGFVAGEIEEILINSGIKSAIVNIGSSSQVLIGNRAIKKGDSYHYTEDIYRIGYSDPNDVLGFGNFVGIYETTNTALSGSGISRQFFEAEDGKIYHHLFDTKTGYPVENELESVQVFTTDFKAADALSTMLFSVGLDKALDYVNNTEGLEAIFLTKDKKFILSDNAPKFEVTNPDFKIIE